MNKILNYEPLLIFRPVLLLGYLYTMSLISILQGSYRFSRIKFKDFSRTFPGLLKSFSSTFMHRWCCWYLMFYVGRFVTFRLCSVWPANHKRCTTLRACIVIGFCPISVSVIDLPWRSIVNTWNTANIDRLCVFHRAWHEDYL